MRRATHHVAILGSDMPEAPIVKLAPAVDVAEQDEPEPPQELALPTAFTAGIFDKVDRLEDQEIKKVTRAKTSACDLTSAPAPHRPQEQACRRRAAGHSEWI